jgi:transposase, IS30 family
MKDAIINAFKKTPEIIKTLTLDNGTEFALHDKISKELNTSIYFANPYSPWERGLNENTNGLIRRFYPKGTDFSGVTEEEILRVQNLLNERPRKTLGFKTPKEVLTKELFNQKEYLQIA